MAVEIAVAPNVLIGDDMPPTSATSASPIWCWLWLKFLRCGCHWPPVLLPGMFGDDRTLPEFVVAAFPREENRGGRVAGTGPAAGRVAGSCTFSVNCVDSVIILRREQKLQLCGQVQKRASSASGCMDAWSLPPVSGSAAAAEIHRTRCFAFVLGEPIKSSKKIATTAMYQARYKFRHSSSVQDV
jgi:hypothetical protein